MRRNKKLREVTKIKRKEVEMWKRGDVEEHDTERSGCEDVGGKAGNEEGGEAGTDIRTLGGLESVSIWRVANGNVCVHSEDSPHAENG